MRAGGEGRHTAQSKEGQAVRGSKEGQVRIVVNVVPPTLTPALVGGSFVADTSGSNRTYTHTINNVVTGSETLIADYTLAGTYLSTSTAVGVASLGDPVGAPFTLTPSSGFTSTDGNVPSGNASMQVAFAPPAVTTPTPYTYTITYTGGGFAGEMNVRIVVNVVPLSPTLTISLVGGGRFTQSTSGKDRTYTHTINGVPSGSANRVVNYTLTGENIPKETAVQVAASGDPIGAPFTLTPTAGSFTSTDGGVPTGNASVQVEFTPPVVSTPTTYTYTITYTGGGVVGERQVRIVANVVPPTLTPSLASGSFRQGTSGSNRTYTHTINGVASGGASITTDYSLAGTNLSTARAVQVATAGNPTATPFTLTGGGGFTSTGGSVPSGKASVQVAFAPPVVARPTTYTYTITYTNGGLAGEVQVRIVVNVLPPPSTLTPSLASGSFLQGSTGSNHTYTHTINDVVSGGSVLTTSYSLAGTYLSRSAVVRVATAGNPTATPFTLTNGGGFTSTDGNVPAGNASVQVAFAPPVVARPTTYTYTITYTNGGLVGEVQVRIVANVVPSTLTPSLAGGRFVAGTSGSNRTYTHTINNVVSGGSVLTASYNLVGENLSTARAVRVATAGNPTATPFTLTNGGGFTSTDGNVPAGNIGSVVGFTPPVVARPTRYTYTITYTGGGLAGGVQVRIVVNVVPSTLTPSLASGSFTPGTSGSNRTYTHTIDGVASGGTNVTAVYTLIGTNLSTARAVSMTTSGNPTATPFTLTNGGDFTSTNGFVPLGNASVRVAFAPPMVASPTTYTYTITYTDGGLAGGVQVRIVVHVVPLSPTLTISLVGGGSFTQSTSGSNLTYTHTINGVASGSANRVVNYTLTGENIPTETAVQVTALGDPIGAPFTLTPTAGSFTSTNGFVPSGQSSVQVEFAPPVVASPTTYTYTITYRVTGLVGGGQVRIVVHVLPPPTLTPALLGGSFVADTSGSNPTYTHTINEVASGGANIATGYTLAGTNLSTSTGVLVATKGDPTATPFTLTNGGNFTSTDGGVPSGNVGVLVAFAPPVVATPTRYIYTITYSDGGLAGAVRVVFVVKVVPPLSTPPMLAPALVGGSFTPGTSGSNSTYTHTINDVSSGGANITEQYRLSGTNLSTTEAVQLATIETPVIGGNSLFTLTPSGSFTSTDGFVPFGKGVWQVSFTPPVVASPTRYTYTITYSEGGLAGDVSVAFVINVVPPLTSTPLGAGAEANVRGSIVLSPNPTSDVLFVRGEASSITLLDVSGHVRRAAIKDEASGDVIRLDLNGLPAGLYVARITTPNGIVTRRIVKQ